MSDIEQNEYAKESPPTLLSNNTVPPDKKNKLSNFLDYIEIFVIAICFVILLFSFSGIRLCTVSGPSMEKTLYNNEKLITSNINYTPKRNDIIVFHQTGEYSFNEPIVKRVIGVAGDTVTVEYEKNNVIVTVTDSNGAVTVLEEDYQYIDKNSYNPYPLPTTVTVEEGTVFVMGDNRYHSADSRDDRIGLVDTRRILGKVIFRISPFSRFGIVK
jgi:signal peptidase I